MVVEDKILATQLIDEHILVAHGHFGSSLPGRDEVRKR